MIVQVLTRVWIGLVDITPYILIVSRLVLIVHHSGGIPVIAHTFVPVDRLPLGNHPQDHVFDIRHRTLRHADGLVTPAVHIDKHYGHSSIVHPRDTPGGTIFPGLLVGYPVDGAILHGFSPGEVVERLIPQSVEYAIPLGIVELVEVVVARRGTHTRPVYAGVCIVKSVYEPFPFGLDRRVPVAVLGEFYVHGVELLPDHDGFRTDLLGHRGGDPVDLGNQDKAVLHLARTGNHLYGLGIGHNVGIGQLLLAT